MTRRRTISLSIIALAAAGLWMIQHDTFLRRWALPPRPQPTLLDRPIADIRFNTDSFESALDALSEATGAKFSPDTQANFIDRALAERQRRPCTREFHAVSLRHVFWSIYRHWLPGYRGWFRAIEDRDGLLVSGRDFNDDKPWVARAYDVGPFLPDDDAALAKSPATQPGAAPISARVAAMSWCRDRAEDVLLPVETRRRVFVFGRRLIVLSDRDDTNAVSDMIAVLCEEEAFLSLFKENGQP